MSVACVKHRRDADPLFVDRMVCGCLCQALPGPGDTTHVFLFQAMDAPDAALEPVVSPDGGEEADGEARPEGEKDGAGDQEASEKEDAEKKPGNLPKAATFCIRMNDRADANDEERLGEEESKIFGKEASK